MRKTAAVIETVMDRRHHNVDDYQIVVPQELLEQHQRTQRIFNTVIGFTAMISLIVGGIGIMNIMLATVTERTKEIGIRRSVGACRRDILRQFLIEAVGISLTGGAFGIVLTHISCGRKTSSPAPPAGPESAGATPVTITIAVYAGGREGAIEGPLT